MNKHESPEPHEPPDAHLQAALRAAPDRDARPAPALRDELLRAAQAAVRAAPAVPPVAPAPWWQRWLDVFRQPAYGAGLASLVLGTVISLMWWERAPPLTPAPPTASAEPEPARSAQPPAQTGTAGMADAAAPPPAPSPPPVGADARTSATAQMNRREHERTRARPETAAAQREQRAAVEAADPGNTAPASPAPAPAPATAPAPSTTPPPTPPATVQPPASPGQTAAAPTEVARPTPSPNEAKASAQPAPEVPSALGRFSAAPPAAAPAAAKVDRALRDDAQAVRETPRLAGAAPAPAAALRSEAAGAARAGPQPPPLRTLLVAVSNPGQLGLTWQGPGMALPATPQARAREWLLELAAATADKWAPASVDSRMAEEGVTTVLWFDGQGLWVQVFITSTQVRWLPRGGPAWVAPLSAAESLRLRTP